MGALSVILLLVLGFGCSEDKADSGGDSAVGGGVQWEVAFDTAGLGALSGVWGSAPDDVFVVGGTPEQAQIMHYDGASWSAMEAPAVPLLVWVFGFGPADVWAVGVGGGFVHYDGASWTALESGTDQDLWGIWGTSPDDLWIVGGDIDGKEPTLLRYDGVSASAFPLDPKQNTRGAVSLFKVWGIGSTLFTVGQKGQILQWDGTTWLNSPTGAEANDDFVSLWGTREDHIVAVGGRSNARISVWDGSAWTTTAPAGVPGLNAAYMSEEGEAVIGGIYGFTGSFDPESGEVREDPVLTAMDVHAIWGDGEGRFYGVGGRFYEPYEGLALVRTGEP